MILLRRILKTHWCKSQREVVKLWLQGAQKIHVLVFESDGKLWQKNLPSENFYKPTRIKIGREMVRSTAENALDEIDEDGSDFD